MQSLSGAGIEVELEGGSLHPKLRWSSTAQGRGPCPTWLYLELPAAVFVDPYELSRLGYVHQLHGPVDLESPEWMSSATTALVRLDGRAGAVPLHLRYLRMDGDSADTRGRQVELRSPVLHQACGRADAKEQCFDGMLMYAV